MKITVPTILLAIHGHAIVRERGNLQPHARQRKWLLMSPAYPAVRTQTSMCAQEIKSPSATTGTVIAGRRIGEVGPEGGKVSGFGAIVGTRPLPTSGPGALIGYIRQPNGQASQPFLVGTQLTLSVPVDGRLYLAINDDDYSDNGGGFKVKIRY